MPPRSRRIIWRSLTPVDQSTGTDCCCHYEIGDTSILGPAEIVVSEESDLWDFLEEEVGFTERESPQLAYDRLPLDLYRGIRIEGWRPQLLYFPEEPSGHTISPSSARAIQEFHQSLSRAYAYLAYNEPNATLLHAEDRAALEFRAKVTSGSSGVEFPSDALATFVEALLLKMSGEQELIAVIILLLLFFGTSVGKTWMRERYDAKKEAKASDERLVLSAEETKRSEILARALSYKPRLQPLVDESEDAKTALVRSATKVPSARVLGTEIDSEIAQTILSKRKEKGEGRRLQGQFEFLWIGNEHEGGYLGRVRSFPDNAEFSVDINKLDLTAEDRRACFDSLENESLVEAHINAWYVAGKIVRAVVMKADPIIPGGPEGIAVSA